MGVLQSDLRIELAKGVAHLGGRELEVGDLQPLAYLRRLRELWGRGCSAGESVCMHPLRMSHPLIEALTRQLAENEGFPFPPASITSQVLPLGEFAQLALLKRDESLARSLLPFCEFPTLWSPQQTYCEEDALDAIALLLQAFGKSVSRQPSSDPYFARLAKELPRWGEGGSGRGVGAELCVSSEMSVAMATLGDCVPLGAMRAGGVRVAAFGPHAYPLNDPGRFGMRRALVDLRWGASCAEPEVWFEASFDSKAQVLDTKWYGLSPQTPMAFAYYVKADSARVGDELFLPKTLKRYQGAGGKVVLVHGGSRLVLENCVPGRMEIIPLAGEGCFWNADFLLAFEIPPFDGRAVFRFNSIHK